MVSSVAACCVLPTTRALLCMVNGYDSAVVRVFLSLLTLTFALTLTFELGRDFCTLYLIAKLDRSTFSRSEVIVRTNILTNKQTPLKTPTALRNATPVGKMSVKTAAIPQVGRHRHDSVHLSSAHNRLYSLYSFKCN